VCNLKLTLWSRVLLEKLIDYNLTISVLSFVVLDVFLKLSDEMVLMIFRWLPKNMLVRCSLVCKRWRRIAYDEVLWTRMDLGSRTLNSGSLGHVLTRGTTILRLAQAEVRGFS
jgi:F-box and leucine-rich repeat protein 1 (S-phase kinase-associated protein 2)